MMMLPETLYKKTGARERTTQQRDCDTTRFLIHIMLQRYSLYAIFGCGFVVVQSCSLTRFPGDRGMIVSMRYANNYWSICVFTSITTHKKSCFLCAWLHLAARINTYFICGASPAFAQKLGDFYWKSFTERKRVCWQITNQHHFFFVQKKTALNCCTKTRIASKTLFYDARFCNACVFFSSVFHSRARIKGPYSKCDKIGKQEYIHYNC